MAGVWYGRVCAPEGLSSSHVSRGHVMLTWLCHVTGIRNALLSTEDHVCPFPTCGESGVSPDTLVPNIILRKTVKNFMNTTGAWHFCRTSVSRHVQCVYISQLQPQRELIPRCLFSAGYNKASKTSAANNAAGISLQPESANTASPVIAGYGHTHTHTHTHTGT